MSEKRYKLHPVSAVVDFVKGLKDLILPFLVIFLANGFNLTFNLEERGFWASFVPLGIFLLLVLILLISGFIKWWTYIYWFEEEELRVEYGLLVKKKRYIPFDRIQSFNYKEGIFHRIFGLVQVMVETAGSTNGKAEVILTAITKDAANQIELVTRKRKEEHQVSELQEGDGMSEETAKPISRIIHKMNTKYLVILATTSSSMGVVIAGVAAVASQFAEFIPFEWIFEEVSAFIKFGFVMVSLAVFGGLLITWLVAVIITFINNYNFTVVEENGRLIITRGLLEKKKVTIPLNRIQAIKIVENPLRQMFGFAAVAVESASGGFGGNDKKITVFPLIRKKDLVGPLKELFPQLEWEQMLKKPPRKAKPFFYRIDFIWLIPLIAFSSYFWFPYGLLSILIVVPAILMGLWQFKTTGFAISGYQLTIVYRIFSRVTFIVEKKRIQALESRQSFFQKKRNITTIQATVMSGISGATAKAPNLSDRDAEEIMEWFEKSNSDLKM
jgi:putative membrane protein